MNLVLITTITVVFVFIMLMCILTIYNKNKAKVAGGFEIEDNSSEERKILTDVMIELFRFIEISGIPLKQEEKLLNSFTYWINGSDYYRNKLEIFTNKYDTDSYTGFKIMLKLYGTILDNKQRLLGDQTSINALIMSLPAVAADLLLNKNFDESVIVTFAASGGFNVVLGLCDPNKNNMHRSSRKSIGPRPIPVRAPVRRLPVRRLPPQSPPHPLSRPLPVRPQPTQVYPRPQPTKERYSDERYSDERYSDERYSDGQYSDERYSDGQYSDERNSNDQEDSSDGWMDALDNESGESVPGPSKEKTVSANSLDMTTLVVRMTKIRHPPDTSAFIHPIEPNSAEEHAIYDVLKRNNLNSEGRARSCYNIEDIVNGDLDSALVKFEMYNGIDVAYLDRSVENKKPYPTYSYVEKCETLTHSMLINDKDILIKYIHMFSKFINQYHPKGYLYIDIKPSNTMISSNGECVITDFDLSHIHDSGSSPITYGFVNLYNRLLFSRNLARYNTVLDNYMMFRECLYYVLLSYIKSTELREINKRTKASIFDKIDGIVTSSTGPDTPRLNIMFSDDNTNSMLNTLIDFIEHGVSTPPVSDLEKIYAECLEVIYEEFL